jgi:hypothetical protein
VESKKEQLSGIVGNNNVIDDSSVLESYSRDQSLWRVADRRGGEHRKGGCGLEAAEFPYNCRIAP